ncbi:MAG TPA: hypothetical protein VGC80_04100, partial [Acetobacteraceae bacterium]
MTLARLSPRHDKVAVVHDPFAPLPPLDPALQAAFARIRADLRDEYRKSHDFPWIIGFSGG